jgi:hypothetical protein
MEYIMGRKAKPGNMAPFEKILNLMVTGEPVTKEEIEILLGDELQMYLVSAYMWHVKTTAKGIVRVYKDGRNVLAYQLINTADGIKYLKDKNIYFAGDDDIQSVQTLDELKSEPEIVVAEPTPVTSKNEEILVVTEITDEQPV